MGVTNNTGTRYHHISCSCGNSVEYSLAPSGWRLGYELQHQWSVGCIHDDRDLIPVRPLPEIDAVMLDRHDAVAYMEGLGCEGSEVTVHLWLDAYKLPRWIALLNTLYVHVSSSSSYNVMMVSWWYQSHHIHPSIPATHLHEGQSQPWLFELHYHRTGVASMHAITHNSGGVAVW